MRGRALAAEPIQRPEEKGIKFASRSSGEHILECIAVGPTTRGIVLVYLHNRPAVTVGKLAKLGQLVRGVLALVACAHPAIDSDSHTSKYGEAEKNGYQKRSFFGQAGCGPEIRKFTGNSRILFHYVIGTPD